MEQQHGLSSKEAEQIIPNRFGKLFPSLQPFRPYDEALQELGRVMEDKSGQIRAGQTPAGYTYLGQFVDHDISRDALGDTNPLNISNQELSRLIQLRTPSLDLDSLYGSGDTELLVAWDQNDPAKFRIGETAPDEQVARSFFNDLPRIIVGREPAKALIGDPRNDENLVVAQIHLAFLKFHNAVLDMLRRRGDVEGKSLTEQREIARAVVVKHYQSVVLHDLIKRFADPSVYIDVVVNRNVRFFDISAAEMAFMPIEFSGAAYRWHTLIRDGYNWNRIFNFFPDREFPDLPGGTLELLFRFTGLQNGNQLVGFSGARLPSNWIADWTRLFDFTHRGVAQGRGFNFIEPVDTQLAPTLIKFGPPRNPMNLAVKNLVRGSRLGLPSAQDIVQIIGVPIVSPDIMLATTNAQKRVLQEWEFHKKTPLWYYINREAEVFGNSERFGPLGSTIFCETFLGLVKGSRISILDEPEWKPDADLLPFDPDFYTFTDLLWFIRESNAQTGVDELNPLG